MEDVRGRGVLKCKCTCLKHILQCLCFDFVPHKDAVFHDVTPCLDIKLLWGTEHVSYTIWLFVTVRHGKIHHAIKNGKPSISMCHLYHGYNVRPPRYLSWFITPITMAYGIYNYSYWGESKPTNISWGPHIVCNSHNHMVTRPAGHWSRSLRKDAELMCFSVDGVSESQPRTTGGFLLIQGCSATGCSLQCFVWFICLQIVFMLKNSYIHWISLKYILYSISHYVYVYI